MLGTARGQLANGNLYKGRAARYAGSALLNVQRGAMTAAKYPGATIGVAAGGIAAGGYMQHRRRG